MQRKIIGLIFYICALVITVLGDSIYYLHFLQRKKAPSTQQHAKREFLEFLKQKKKFLQKDKFVSLVAVGDISYSRGVERIIKKENNINYPFLKIQDYLKSADLVFGNLETPITTGHEILDFEMIFRSNPGTEHALKQAGFSVLSLANNHTPDFGEKGLKDTLNYLEAVDIKYVGAGKNEQEAYQPIYIERNGVRFAFLAYTDINLALPYYEASENRAGTAFMRTEKMTEAVKEAKEKADFVIVSMHSGDEYADKPNASQVNFAHAAINAGADLIIGHHPHVVQKVEKYREKFIFYSLGTFVFDQLQNQETNEGLVLKIYFTRDKINKISLLPVVMENLAQPTIANSNEAEKILKRLSFSFNTRTVYSWNSEKNSFQKNYEAIIYLKDFKDNTIISKQEEADLNNNLVKETYMVENGRLTVSENSKTIWKSPDEWWIDDFILADSNNDGVTDINLSLWKVGSFGSSKPFWIKEDDLSVKNHFFVLDLIDSSIKPVWGSSNLAAPNCEFRIDDIDNDRKNDLVVIEGDYSQRPRCHGGYVAVWKWNGWGFSNEWRSEKGNFSDLEIEKIGGKKYILVDTQ